MINIIICFVLYIIGLTLTILTQKDILDKTGEFMYMLLMMLSLLMAFGTVMIGYGNNHIYKKEYIISLLEEEVNLDHINMAIRWNKEEKMSNNYWFRFTLKEEELIDINYYLIRK